MHENNLEFYLRNSLTSVAIGFLSYYNISYTSCLVNLMGDHHAFRNGVRCKIICISSLIQVCLVLRFIWIWTCNFFWWSKNGAEYYLVFESTFFSLSEVVPFLIFCIVLTCRIHSYSLDYKKIVARRNQK
jgi:hypothetical protein